MKLQNQNSRVSENSTERDDLSATAADVVFHCAIREDKVGSSTAEINLQATTCLRSIK